jgi:hypothetical protein
MRIALAWAMRATDVQSIQKAWRLGIGMAKMLKTIRRQVSSFCSYGKPSANHVVLPVETAEHWLNGLLLIE